MSETLVQQQLARLNALLSEERAGPGLVPAPPEIAATEVGALQAVGYQTRKPDVRVTVFVFGDSSLRRAAAERLKDRHDGEKDVYARTNNNGPMLFFAHTNIGGRKGRDAEYRLDRILSAFAGDE
ncbi:MAG: hypothetical protein JNL34_15360 [Anaerolineae bacterium]|nr:hypothetical protein [Anaerolineae bacterium]